MKLGKVSRK